MKKPKNSQNSQNPNSEKKKYNSPKLTTESLMVYGALCNGTSTAGGRKATVPAGCTTAKLHS